MIVSVSRDKGSQMLDISHIRIILRVFLTLWGIMCGLIAIVGFAGFVLSLDRVLGIGVFGDFFRIESPLQMLGMTFAFMVVPIGFIFIARSWFRPVLTHIEELEKQRQEPSDSNSPDTNHFNS